REMALEEPLVSGHVLVGEDAARACIDALDAVDQQERITMRQQFADPADVDRRCDVLAHCFPFLSCAAILRASASSCLKRAAFLRQSRFSIKGVPEEYSPGARIEPVTRLMAVTVTRSQISICPTMPTAPPIRA